MAQASSVPAREPSMEEILASIRRIIEDSDTGQPPANAGAAQPITENSPPPEYAPAAAEAETPVESAGEIEAFRTELSAMEREAELQQAPVAAAPPQPAAESDYRPPFVAAPEPEFRPDASALSASLEAQPAPPTAASAPEHEPPAAGPESAVNYHAPARGSILSEQAGRQVAAAFEELSDAFASTQRRSFDDVAEEMMRPMLQDWLDNNLPLLVERLVREEIERVARGGSR